MRGEKWDILLSLAQGRDPDPGYAQPVEQVPTERTIGYTFIERDIGCSNDTRVGLLCALRAERGELLVLQDPQQFGLHRRRHLADLVQEQRAAVGVDDAPLLGRDGSGEGAAEVAKTTGYMPPNKAANEIILADFYKKNPNKQTAVDQLPLLRDWQAYPGENGLAITQVIYDKIEKIVTGEADDMKALQQELVEEVNELTPQG